MNRSLAKPYYYFRIIFKIEAECKKLIQTCNSNYSKDLYQVIVGNLEKAIWVFNCLSRPGRFWQY